MRACFIASEGKVLLSRDLSQIELRVLAHESQDPVMIDIFRRDGDIHIETTLRAFKLTWDDWRRMSADAVCKCEHSPEQHWPKNESKPRPCRYCDCQDYKHRGEAKQKKLRAPVKNVNFGIVYGLSSLGLQQQLAMMGISWTEFECQDFIDLWFSIYPSVKQYMADIYQMARRYGLVYDAVGRVRLVPGIRSVHTQVQNAALREAGNFPIQSFAAAILKLAMARCEAESGPVFRDAGIYCEPLMQIHDELLYEVDEDYVECAADYFGEIMNSAAELRVPLKSEANWGRRWEK
jgi:DNA polymerase-1